MGEVISDGLKIRYEVEGEGIPLVILSYDFQARTDTRRTDGLLQAGYKVIGIDFRGSGQSQPVTEPAQLRGGYCVRDVLAILDSLGIDERAIFMGYSQGAGHSLRMALTCPERVRSLVLGGLGGGALAMSGLYFKSALNSRQKLVPWGETLLQLAKSQDEKAMRYWETYIEALQQDALEYGNLEAISVPTLIIVGENDSHTDFAAFYVTQMLEERIPNSRRIVIEGTNHMTCAQDPRFWEAVTSFLRSQSH